MDIKQDFPILNNRKTIKFYCNNENHSLKENHNILIPFKLIIINH